MFVQVNFAQAAAAAFTAAALLATPAFAAGDNVKVRVQWHSSECLDGCLRC